MKFKLQSSEIKAVEFKITYACNSDCVFCSFPKESASGSMSYLDFVRNWRYLQGEENCNIDNVLISGGEPTIHKEFHRILEFLVWNGSPNVYLHTNAIEFADKGFTNDNAHLIDRVMVGFYFPNSAVCEKITGSAEEYDLRVNGIENLLDAKVPTRVNVVITNQTIKTLPETIEQILDMGIQAALFTMPFYTGRVADDPTAFGASNAQELVEPLKEAVAHFAGKGGVVAIQGVPLCYIREQVHMQEVDLDRLLIDSSHQFHTDVFVFSHVLTYKKVEACASCKLSEICWGPWVSPDGIMGFHEVYPIMD